MNSVTRNMMVTGLRDLGLDLGSQVLVHSSLSSLGHVEGAAGAVIDALLESVGPAGTVMVPTLTGTESDSPQNPPAFDPIKSPSWTGLIPEMFRKRSEATRSIHPTHSVAAIGANASELLTEHIDSITPCDERSPYGRLAREDNAYILLLGVEHESNTTFHHVEELASAEYHMQKELTPATLVLGEKRITRQYLLHQWGSPRRFNVMEKLFEERGIQRTGKIGDANVRLIGAKAMVQATLQCLRANRSFLLRDQPSL